METMIYTVRPGDTLSSIATKFGSTVNMIAHYNGISDPDVINVGQTLRIPVSTIPDPASCRRNPDIRPGVNCPLRTQTASEAVGKMPMSASSGNDNTLPVSADAPVSYTIQSGDTLTSVADSFGVSVNDLARYNGIADPDVIEAGRTIRIPVKTSDNILKYTVRDGDSLWKIAGRFNVSLTDLINLNRLPNPDLIYPGQTILIEKR